MSFLDLDERLIDLAAAADLVYSPIIDVKEFPADVDVTLVEGTVANEDNLEMLKKARARTRCLVAFGDCAVTGNVPAMRNPLGGPDAVLERAYLDPTNLNPRIPRELPVVPPLLERVVPIHHVVQVDCFLPGCPPPADLIWFAVGELIAGRMPELTGKYHFG
jgi:NAD-reducing hydrogenase small subunit